MFLDHMRAALARPTHVSASSFWHGHVPFAHYVVACLRPRKIVEFGVEHGDSLFAFADALKWNAVEGGVVVGCDSWEGDRHVGRQHEWIFDRVNTISATYGPTIQLMRDTTVECAKNFDDGSIDILHIDASHDYESVRNDYEAMVPKLSQYGVVLFHDIVAFGEGFGVWRLWNELARQFPHLCFAHSAGLGVLAPRDPPETLKGLFDSSVENRTAFASLFARLGRAVVNQYDSIEQQRRLEEVARLPVPSEIAEDLLLARCLDDCRW